MNQYIPRPLPFILASTETGMMIVNHQDRCTATNGSQFGVGYQYLSTSAFDPQEVRNTLFLLNLRRQYYGDGVVALDCGANIGAHSIAWGIEMTHWGKVIAFEAQERIYYALAGNVAINNCFNVKALNQAVGNPDVDSRCYIDIPIVDYTQPASFGSLELKQSSQNEFIGQPINYQNLTKVELIAIDSLNLTRLDYMKIDVEGMEIDVLKGAMNSIAAHKPILQIEIIKSDLQEITQYLDNFGYHYIQLGINLLAFHQSDPIKDQIQINP